MNKNKYISIAFVLIFLLYNYVFEGLINGVNYGTPANAIRKVVKIPIIESNMVKVKLPGDVEGGRWEGKIEEQGLTHLWKIVSPNSGIYVLDEEIDAYRKSFAKGKYYQLNVTSKIIGDSLSERKGILTFYNGSFEGRRQLDENGLDSIFKEWGMESLLREKR